MVMRSREWPKQPAGPTRCAFSAIELLVVLGIVVILISIFIPYVLKRREDNYRLRCDDNLRKLGAAFTDYAYAGKNGGDYPRVVSDPNFSGYTCFTGTDSPDPFAKNSIVRANDVTASLWLLVRLKLAQPEDFICPSTGDAADWTREADRLSKSNFRGTENLSYSYACPFSTAPGYRLNKDTLAASFAIMADKNPGILDGLSDVTRPSINAPPLEMAMANSRNHGRALQQVLYADGHVERVDNPYCDKVPVPNSSVTLRDNIYTARATVPVLEDQTISPEVNGVIGNLLGPAALSDSYLVPSAQDLPSGPALIAASTMPATTQATSTTIPSTTRAAPPATAPIVTTTQSATIPATAPNSTQATTQPSTRSH